MRQQSGKSLFIAALLTGTLGYSSGAFACKPSVDSSNNVLQETCIGSGALYRNNGLENTAMGYQALFKTTTAGWNTAVGYRALYSNTLGVNNSALGDSALFSNTTGYANSAIGYNSLYYNTTGAGNIAFGMQALWRNTTGNSNSAIGNGALFNNNTGSYNVAIGVNAGYNLTTGSNNIDIANQGVVGDSATIRIGTPGTQTKIFLAGIWGSTATGSTVTVNSSGQLGVVFSSRRYKEDIKPMGNVSDKLLELRPVTFHYKKPDEEGKKPIQYGLIAEEVDAVMPELVVRNKDGSPETVAYQYIPSLLLNEYQKQHKELVDTKAKLVSVEKVSAQQEANAKASAQMISELEAKEKVSAQKMAEMQSQIDKLNAITKKLMAALPSNTKTAMAK